MKNIVLLSVAMMVAYLCSAQDKSVTVKESLPATEFKSKLESTPEGVLLDVRTPEEVKEGSIAGAVNIDFNAADFKQKLATLDKDKTYFIYCAKGGRSSKAMDLMYADGFKKLYNLEDGFTGWKEKGLPVKKK